MTQNIGVVFDSQVGVVRCSLGDVIGIYKFGHLCTLGEMQARASTADKRSLLTERATKKFVEAIRSASSQLQSA